MIKTLEPCDNETTNEFRANPTNIQSDRVPLSPPPRQHCIRQHCRHHRVAQPCRRISKRISLPDPPETNPQYIRRQSPHGADSAPPKCHPDLARARVGPNRSGDCVPEIALPLSQWLQGRLDSSSPRNPQYQDQRPRNSLRILFPPRSTHYGRYLPV